MLDEIVDELVRNAIAVRTVSLSRKVLAADIVDAVREVAGVDYVERLVFVNDRIAYTVGRRSRAPSQNVVIAACDGSLSPHRLSATVPYGHFLAVNGDLEGKKPLAVEGRHLYYREVKAFAERVRLAVEDRIKDPAILKGRPPVALFPSHVTD